MVTKVTEHRPLRIRSTIEAVSEKNANEKFSAFIFVFGPNQTVSSLAPNFYQPFVAYAIKLRLATLTVKAAVVKQPT